MKNRRKNRKVLLLTLIAVLLMGVLSVGDNPPVQSAWNAVTGGIFSLSARIAAELKTPSTDELLDENERLRSENAALQKALAENLELKDENKTLWGYFGMKKDAPELELKPAFVLRRASADDFGGFTLGVGSDLGVKVNNAVICESGLVGRVTAADSSSCRVATLFSPDSRVAVIDGETSDSGILVGKDGGLVLTQLSESNHIKTGDMILTSGDGGVYPPRVIVGKVSELGTRAALISIELFALYILENTPQLSPEAGGVKPLFLVAAALSLTSDEVTAATIYGAVCGVLTDLESGAVGFFAVTLTVLCYFQSTLLHTAFRRNLPSVWLLSLGAAAAVFSADFVIRLVFGTAVWQRCLIRAALTYLAILPLSVINFRRMSDEE